MDSISEHGGGIKADEGCINNTRLSQLDDLLPHDEGKQGVVEAA